MQKVYIPSLQTQFILTILRHSSSEAKNIDLLPKPSPLEWRNIIQAVDASQVLPFFMVLLNSMNRYEMSIDISNLVNSKLKIHNRKNLRLIFELNRVIKTLNDNGIEVLPYKGLTLSVVAYGSLYLRHFNDVDFLVKKNKYLEVQNILHNLGYITPNYLPFHSVKSNNNFREYFGEYTAVHPKGNICIDVHRYILGGGNLTLKLDSDRFWARRIQVLIGGQDIWTLCPSDNLLYLCMNGLKDDWQSLRTVCDISELIKNHPDLCWNKLFQEAIELKIARPLLLGILIARYLLSTPIPHDVLTSLEKDVIVTSVARKACTRLKMSLDGDTRSHFIEILWMKWVVLNEKGSRRRYLSGILSRIWRLSFSINYRDIEDIKLPSSLRFLYYFIRIFRIFKNPLDALKLIFR
jgi:Uncharacterised nucleotidyltransferase